MVSKRLAIVTGANRGIGYEIARQLAAFGVDVLATSRDPAKGQAVAKELGVRYFPLDVTQKESIEAVARHVGDGFDVLINNAGITMKGFDENVARRTLDVNFFGAKNTTDRLLPLLRSGGRMVMVSSGMGELSIVSPELRARFEDPSLTEDELGQLMESFVRE